MPYRFARFFRVGIQSKFINKIKDKDKS